MFKKFFLILMILGICLFSVEDNAEAVVEWDFYTTDKDSSIPKVEFGWDEQPYSYLFIDRDSFDTIPEVLDIKWQWFYVDDLYYEEHYFYFPWNESTDEEGNFRIWESPQYWLSMREFGDWSARVVWRAEIEGNWTGYRWRSFDFTVTPEPVSSILFITGGAILIGRRYLRRKKYNV
jgi:hypothetical protein